jgi:hypothetical protein
MSFFYEMGGYTNWQQQENYEKSSKRWSWLTSGMPPAI